MSDLPPKGGAIMKSKNMIQILTMIIFLLFALLFIVMI